MPLLSNFYACLRYRYIRHRNDIRKRDLALTLGSGQTLVPKLILQLKSNDHAHKHFGGGKDLDAPDDELVWDDGARFSTTEEAPVSVVVDPAVDAANA
jgi:hypothetical protein